jgi:hypothetical protein
MRAACWCTCFAATAAVNPLSWTEGEGVLLAKASARSYFAATATASPLSSTFLRNVAYLARVRSNDVGYS